MTHVHIIFESGWPGLAVVDIFRIENGLIAEHWDVAMPVSAKPAHAMGCLRALFSSEPIG